ncbi:MAG: hypothetical protein JOZ15_11055 [Acidobacteria bacterium]|nr:hypothetical protein [Acidobacteriota bacterium]
MSDSVRNAQEERAKRLRQQIEEITERTSTGSGNAPRTPRDFVNPGRTGTAPGKMPKNP